jgi:hypothetical protein
VSLAFYDFDFFLRQSIQLINQLVNLSIRRLDLALIQRAVTLRRGGVAAESLDQFGDLALPLLKDGLSYGEIMLELK